MSNYIYKLLVIDGVLPRANDELRDIVMASDGDGYEALYNILRFVHPKFTDTKVETKIPCQGISDTFAHHVKNIRNTIENEAIRGRVYSRYEGLELVIGTLHPKYEAALGHKTEMAFDVTHDQVNNIPFELKMSNLGKTLGGWALKLGLNETRSPRISKIFFTDAPDTSTPRIASLPGGTPCDFCQMTGHTKDTCQWFVNHILAVHFAKENPSLSEKVLQENKSFMRIKRRNNADLHGDRFKTKTNITHLAEDVTRDALPDIVSHIASEPDTDDCNEIIHGVFAMVCRVAAEGDSIDFDGSDDDFFVDRPIKFDDFENDDGEIYDAGLIARLTSNWDEELRSTGASPTASHAQNIVSSSRIEDRMVSHIMYDLADEDTSIYDDCVRTLGDSMSGKDWPTVR
jgi:hypothetical protein